MTLKEKMRLCSVLYTTWVISEEEGIDFKEHDEKISNLFIARMLKKKFEVFDIDVVIPDELISLLEICTEANPGQTQVILMDLFMHINKLHHFDKIPRGYVIKAMDAAMCFVNTFPIIEIPSVDEKYHKMWLAQKYTDPDGREFNLCDTQGWWKEVVE